MATTTTRFRTPAVVVWLIAAAAGCASDPRPKYVSPATPKEENAVLKGSWGTYIHEVDGAPVASANVYMDNFGGNTVQVSPGTHDLVVRTHTSSSGGTAAMVTHHNSTTGTHFTFTCEKGHTYEFSPRNMFNTKLKVTDKTAGTTVDVDPQD